MGELMEAIRPGRQASWQGICRPLSGSPPLPRSPHRNAGSGSPRISAAACSR